MVSYVVICIVICYNINKLTYLSNVLALQSISTACVAVTCYAYVQLQGTRSTATAESTARPCLNRFTGSAEIAGLDIAGLNNGGLKMTDWILLDWTF